MKTKNRKPARPTNEIGNLPGFRDTPREMAAKEIEDAQQPEETKRNRLQLSFDLLEDGTPDFSNMRDSTRKKVIEFINHPRTATEFGTKASTGQVIDLFPMGPDDKYPVMIGSLYNVIGTLESLAAQRFMGLPPEIASRAFTYSEMEKQILSPPTVKVLNKYAPAWLIKYQDEIALATLFINITIAKVNMARHMAKVQPISTAQPASQVESVENEKKVGVM